MKIKPSNDGVVVELAAKETGLPGRAASPFCIRKILVPVDFSECSRKALRYAVPFATQFGASLTLLYVAQVNYAVGEFGMIDSPLMEGQVREAAEKALENLLRDEIAGAVPASKQTRIGRPASEIAAAAKDINADLIIISTHGHTGLKHVLLGSVTEHVARLAPCPVLVVREEEHEFLRG
ncbi:MAG: universal stress protein [Limisphaerales bacterium]